MELLIQIAISALIVLGGAFALVGSWGIVRLSSVMERLHGPTKATTLGLGAMLVASVLFFQLERGTWSAHELLITLFLFITAPITANMIAKVHLHRRRAGLSDEPESRAGDPPHPGGTSDWATFQSAQPHTPAATSEQ
ncbi:Na+/H+ antiporter subunit G [Sphingomonas sp. M1-B02]|uniref:Na+/H+ antiporter subunit G n=1 Tax=Sphingomonas sp. M1-B02 TaxID=3114300 RepID=UPI00223ECF00|nr:Na+/H+ antiporter subunit G [Sphingomonas sp. S6-11]UZK66329.1 Na+/H+ antiporter subunit G [Sphingomonas sp. S6-11]